MPENTNPKRSVLGAVTNVADFIGSTAATGADFMRGTSAFAGQWTDYAVSKRKEGKLNQSMSLDDKKLEFMETRVDNIKRAKRLKMTDEEKSAIDKEIEALMSDD